MKLLGYYHFDLVKSLNIIKDAISEGITLVYLFEDIYIFEDISLLSFLNQTLF